MSTEDFLSGDISVREFLYEDRWVNIGPIKDYIDEGKRTTNEVTAGELVDVNLQDKEFLKLMPRVRELHFTNYVGMDNRKTFRFRTDSGTDSPGPSYFQRLRFPDMDAVMFDIEVGDKNEVETALNLIIDEGDVEVWCGDPSFQWWGWGFILNQLDALWASGPDPNYSSIPPNIRNDNRKRVTCKHLHLVLTKLNDHKSDMVDDLIKQQKAGKYERPSFIPAPLRKGENV